MIPGTKLGNKIYKSAVEIVDRIPGKQRVVNYFKGLWDRGKKFFGFGDEIPNNTPGTKVDKDEHFPEFIDDPENLSKILSTKSNIPEIPNEVYESLTKSQQKSIRSFVMRIKEHEDKLAAYIKNPDKYDNQGYLKNAPNNEVRKKIIDTRIKHLRKEIETFNKNIINIINGK